MPLPYDVVLYHQFLDSHLLGAAHAAAEADIDRPQLMVTALRVIAKRAPQARVVIASNALQAFRGIPGVTCERHVLDDPRLLALDRTRYYRDYIAARLGRVDRAGVVFLDTDILVLKDLSLLFSRSFDVALTCIEAAVSGPPAPLDRWGVPTDGRLSAINFGMIAARFTSAAVDFFDAVLDRYAALIADGSAFLQGRRNVFRDVQSASERGVSALYRIDDIRTWGGAQFAVVSIMSEHLFRTLRQESEVAGAKVLLLPADRWNYTPPANGAITERMLKDRFVLHLKGTRKAHFATVAARLV